MKIYHFSWIFHVKYDSEISSISMILPPCYHRKFGSSYINVYSSVRFNRDVFGRGIKRKMSQRHDYFKKVGKAPSFSGVHPSLQHTPWLKTILINQP